MGGLRASLMSELPRAPYTRSSQDSLSTTVLVDKALIGPVRGLGPQKGRKTPLGTSGTYLDRGRQS